MGYQLGGKTVLITGAAMGMGKLYALKAVQENARRLILWDINEEKLKETARELEGKGSEIYVDVVDLSQLQEIQKAAQRTKQLLHDQSLDVLINNAGVISSKQYFWNLDDIKDVYFTMSINSLAPMYVTHAFIKEMIEDSRTPKRILNIASAAALVSNPNMSAYVASKCACLGWSDTLRLELKKAKKNHIRVTTFCPTYINTGMFKGAKGMLLMPILTPQKAVNTAWAGMKKGKAIIYKLFIVRLSFVKSIVPIALWDWMIKHIFRVYSSMENFEGRVEN